VRLHGVDFKQKRTAAANRVDRLAGFGLELAQASAASISSATTVITTAGSTK
jgi:hypothetical protein